MDVFFENDPKLNRTKLSQLKHMLSLIFPEVSGFTKDFLIQLTPDELKRAYMRQVENCYSDSYEQLNWEERKSRQMRYQQLLKAYNALLPRIDYIHERIQEIESYHKANAVTAKLPRKTILAVGGAKGGVGKSVLAANLAVGLSLLGQRVVLADLDLGAADTHLYLGVKNLSADWNDFLDKKIQSVEEILTPTPFEGMSFIGGDASRLGSANLNYLQKLKIIRHLQALKCDYVILDLGGDTSFSVLDFFLIADHKLVVTAAEPASFLDSYNFVKVSFHRFLDRFFAEHNSLKDLRGRISEVLPNRPDRPVFNSILQEVRSKDPSAYSKLKLHLERYRLSIVVNMAENGDDIRVAESLKCLLEEVFSLQVGILGTIPLDMSVRKAVRHFTPFLIEDFHCKASQALHQMLAGILLLREPDSIRVELLKKMKPIRDETKDWIANSEMTLDGLTKEEIRFVSNRSPDHHQVFRKILKLIAN